MGKISVQTFAVCAGSGASVLSALEDEPLDMILTGELSHHEVLAARAAGRFVALCGHAGSERGYLRVMRQKLQSELDEIIGEHRVEVVLSQKDKSPLEIFTH